MSCLRPSRPPIDVVEVQVQVLEQQKQLEAQRRDLREAKRLLEVEQRKLETVRTELALERERLAAERVQLDIERERLRVESDAANSGVNRDRDSLIAALKLGKNPVEVEGRRLERRQTFTKPPDHFATSEVSRAKTFRLGRRFRVESPGRQSSADGRASARGSEQQGNDTHRRASIAERVARGLTRAKSTPAGGALGKKR